MDSLNTLNVQVKGYTVFLGGSWWAKKKKGNTAGHKHRF